MHSEVLFFFIKLDIPFIGNHGTDANEERIKKEIISGSVLNSGSLPTAVLFPAIRHLAD